MRQVSLAGFAFLAALLAAAIVSTATAYAQDVVGGMSVDQWYAYVCGNDGEVFKWLARGAIGVAAASLLANARNYVPAGLRWVIPMVDTFALNFAKNAAARQQGAPPAKS